MDESGKVLAMGAVSGYTDKSGENQVQRKGAVKTINGVPYLMGSASVSGTYASPSVPGIVALLRPAPSAVREVSRFRWDLLNRRRTSISRW